MKYIDKTTQSGKVVKLKNYKRRARRNKIRRKVLLFLLILVAISFFLMYAPFMKVKSINCYGNSKIESKELVSASGFCIGNNIIRVNKSKALKTISDLPYVRDVKIRRRFPSKINIAITECQIFAYAKLKDTYICIDEQGKILELMKQQPEPPSCVLLGVQAKTPKVGQPVSFKNEKQDEAYRDLAAVLYSSDFKDIVTSIDLTKVDDIKVMVGNTLEVKVGNAENLDYKINFLASGAYLNIGSNRKGTLDVSFGTNATFKEIY